jgi:hypothetical protein
LHESNYSLLWKKRFIYVPCRTTSIANNDSYDLVCLKKDEAHGRITSYTEPKLIHHNKDNKGAKKIWDAFKNFFGTVNTTQAN